MSEENAELSGDAAIEQIGVTLNSEEPSVKENAVKAMSGSDTIDIEPEKPQINAVSDEVLKEFADKRDGNRRKFNPEIHEVSNGRPVLTKSGNLKKIGKRSSVSAPASQETPINTSFFDTTTPEDEAEQITEAERAEELAATNRKALGTTIAGLTFAVGRMIGGDEWAPVEDEESTMVQAWSDYLEATGKDDLPPGLALCAVIGMYAFPRFNKPKTLSKLTRFRVWAYSKWLKMRGKQIEHGTQFDNRKDGERKDKPSQEVNAA